MRYLIRGFFSVGFGFLYTGAVARKLATTAQWYLDNNYATVTEPLTLWQFLLKWLVTAVILFVVFSLVSYVRNWKEIPNEETTSETEEAASESEANISASAS